MGFRRTLEGRIIEEVTCPKDSGKARVERDRVRSSVSVIREQHEVETTSRIVLRDEKPALKLIAACSCGWSESSIIRTNEGGI